MTKPAQPIKPCSTNLLSNIHRALLTFVLGSIILAVPAVALPPKVAPGVYKTPNYHLTFRVPSGTTYCPLPDNWIGSDHGTTLFLKPPKDCADEAGYPSSGRTFTPGNTPRIEIFYSYYDAEDMPSRINPCSPGAERIYFMGRPHRLCAIHRDGLTGFEVTATYPIDHPDEAEATFTLLTTQKRLHSDLMIFKKLIANTQACTEIHKPQAKGTGDACPTKASWF